MNNNDVLRRLRYTFDYDDSTMIKLFGLGTLKVTRSEVSDWLKRDDNEEFKEIYDKQLAAFLNGMIIDRRGKRDGETPKPEKTLSNNLVLRKLKIALNLQSEDMLAILKLADMTVSKHELSAFFRKPSASQYRLCKDQFLRRFLEGLQYKYA